MFIDWYDDNSKFIVPRDTNYWPIVLLNRTA